MEKVSPLLESLFAIAKESQRDPLQEEAWNRFLAQGLPTKEETFRYVSFHEFLQMPFSKSRVFLETSKESPAPIPKRETPCFTFVNGRLDLSLSHVEEIPKGIVFCTLKEAMRLYSSLLKGRFAKFMQEQRHAFSFLNYALFEEGFFLYIPPKMKLSTPIEIRELYSGSQPEMYFPKMSIYIGKEAQVKFKHSVSSGESPHFINGFREFHLEQGASCKVEQSVMEATPCFYFDQTAAYLKRDAHFSYIGGDRGGKVLRQEFNIDLLEDNAEAYLKGLSLVYKKDESHHQVLIRHLAPNCRSHQHFKALIVDKAKGSFEGKIFVDQVAQHTEAYQLSNYLLLGERATGYSKPNLEIFADEVKASHGATIAQLKEEELFYLRARGVSRAHAKQLLIKGFCQELIQEMDVSTQEAMSAVLEEILQHYEGILGS
jgi:Fe-S cluster assembly protein SufD